MLQFVTNKKTKGDIEIMGFIVLLVLAVLIFIGLKNKKKIAAQEQKSAEEKKITEQKTAEEKKIIEQKTAEEKKIAVQKAAEEKKIAEQKAAEDFSATFDVAGAIESILSVLEKSRATADNFEKGVAHTFDKNEINIPKEKFLLIMKNELFKRAFSNNDCVAAKVVVEDYFQQSVILSTSGLFDKYMRFRASRDQGYGLANFEHPFIKALYGIAGRVANYQINGFASESYQVVSPEYYMGVIEESDALKSYTDSDPFNVDEVRKAWATDIYNAPIELVNSSDLSSILQDEKNIDEGFYLAYIVMCQELGQDPNEMTGIVPVASAYLKCMKKEYERIHS